MSILESSAGFYNRIPPSSLPLPDALRDAAFHILPNDWSVVIADIRNSTEVVARGGRNDVNLVAVGALVAALNVARKAGIEIPFFFGGDGGTVLVPELILPEVLRALREHNSNAKKHFGIQMHLGAVDGAAIAASGQSIRIAKVVQSKGFCKAIVLGDGLTWAEQRIKSAPIEALLEGRGLNMDGLECRWDRIKPPKKQSEVVCYLIQARDPAAQAQVYREVLLEADRRFGDSSVRNPLSAEKLKLQVTVQKMRNEMFARWGRWKPVYLLKELVKTAVGKVVFRHKLKFAGVDGGKYISEIISNADTLTIDGRINTIIAGTADQHAAFVEFLDAQETSGQLVYGHFINRASIMTCYIEDRSEKHVHFVDGSEGGYTGAAQELKRKLRGTP